MRNIPRLNNIVLVWCLILAVFLVIFSISVICRISYDFANILWKHDVGFNYDASISWNCYAELSIVPTVPSSFCDVFVRSRLARSYRIIQNFKTRNFSSEKVSVGKIRLSFSSSRGKLNTLCHFWTFAGKGFFVFLSKSVVQSFGWIFRISKLKNYFDINWRKLCARLIF